MELYRFKSNPETIVKRYGDKMVMVVWSKSFEWGGNCNFCYGYDPENLIPLTESEVQVIEEKRSKRGLTPWTQTVY
jgi:hypothetical protein